MNRVTPSISKVSLYSARLHLPVCSLMGLFCAQQYGCVLTQRVVCSSFSYFLSLGFELVNAMGCLFQRARNYLCTCGSLGVYYYNDVHGCDAHTLVVSDFSCFSNE